METEQDPTKSKKPATTESNYWKTSPQQKNNNGTGAFRQDEDLLEDARLTAPIYRLKKSVVEGVDCTFAPGRKEALYVRISYNSGRKLDSHVLASCEGTAPKITPVDVYVPITFLLALARNRVEWDVLER